jgi:hypothetical protein
MFLIAEDNKLKRYLLLRLFVKSESEHVFKRRLNCLSTCSVQWELDLVVVNTEQVYVSLVLWELYQEKNVNCTTLLLI